MESKFRTSALRHEAQSKVSTGHVVDFTRPVAQREFPFYHPHTANPNEAGDRTKCPWVVVVLYRRPATKRRQRTYTPTPGLPENSSTARR
jgi:hypothetical protein